MSEELPQELTTRKSILDSIPVEDKAFPLSQHRCGALPPNKRAMGVVGNCPQCAAPVYGHSSIMEGDPPPTVVHTCSCWRRAGIVEQKMEHQGK